MAITTDQVIPTPAKTPEQRAAALEAWSDQTSRPLGTQAGENFGMPQNYRVPPARIYVINHSRTHEWKRVIVPVSAQRGAEEALIADKKLAQIYNVDTLVKRVEQGKDMSRYKTEIHPAAFKVRVPGGPNGKMGSFPSRDIIVPPAQSAEDKPVAVEVPEGTWDLYLGNFDRMQGYANSDRVDAKGNPISPDPQIANDARVMLAKFWQTRHNPVFSYTVDGKTTDLNNPYGVLEFVRVTQRAVTEPIDKAYLEALDILEV